MFSNVESEIYLIFLSATALLAVLNPFGNLTQFLAMSDGLPLDFRQRLFRVILYTSCAIVLAFLFSGSFFMKYVFRVELDDLRIAGGLIIVIMSAKNLLFSAKMAVQDFSHYQEMNTQELLSRSLIPMAFPMLVGPGTLTTIVVMSEEAGLGIATGAVGFSFVFLFILFHFSATIERVVGKLILHVFARICQVFIMAMGVKMVLVGLKGFFNL